MKSILAKEKIKDNNGKVITDMDDLTSYQEIQLAKKYPEEFCKYWKKRGISPILSEFFGDFLISYPQAWSFVKSGAIELGCGSWATILSNLSEEDLKPYKTLIAGIPDEFIQEILLVDGEAILKMAIDEDLATVVKNRIYSNLDVDISYVLKHCRKNVEVLEDLIFLWHQDDDILYSLVKEDPTWAQELSNQSEYEFSVPRALQLVRKHPQLIKEPCIPSYDFNDAQWQSIIELYPKDKNLLSLRNEILGK